MESRPFGKAFRWAAMPRMPQLPSDYVVGVVGVVAADVLLRSEERDVVRPSEMVDSIVKLKLKLPPLQHDGSQYISALSHLFMRSSHANGGSDDHVRPRAAVAICRARAARQPIILSDGADSPIDPCLGDLLPQHTHPRNQLPKLWSDFSIRTGLVKQDFGGMATFSELSLFPISPITASYPRPVVGQTLKLQEASLHVGNAESQAVAFSFLPPSGCYSKSSDPESRPAFVLRPCLREPGKKKE
jgi:hypothetical protein